MHVDGRVITVFLALEIRCMWMDGHHGVSSVGDTMHVDRRVITVFLALEIRCMWMDGHHGVSSAGDTMRRPREGISDGAARRRSATLWRSHVHCFALFVH